MEHLKPNGRAGIIVPEGIIFQKGTAYKTIRKKLIENYLIGLVSLPSGIFQPYSGVKTSILILDKTLNQKSKEIFIATINNDGFSLGATRLPIKENDLDELSNQLKNDFFSETKFINIIEKQKILNNEFCDLNASTYQEEKSSIRSNFDSFPLGDLIDIEYGTRLVKKNSQGDLYPVYGGGGETFRTNEFNRKDCLIISRFAMSSNCVRFIKDRFFLNDSGLSLKIKSNKIIEEFLHAILLNIQDKIYCLGRGVGQKNLDIDQFKKLTIPLPSLEIQRDTINEIAIYMKIIDGCRQIIENYKPTFEIDPKWEMVELGALFNFQNGYAFKSEDFVNDGIQLVRMGNIKKGFFDIDNKAVFLPKEFESKYEKFILSDNDLIISMTGTTGKEDYGNVCKISGGKFLLNQRVGRFLKKSNNINEQFFYYLTQTKFFRSKLFAKSSGGVRQANISGDAIKAIEIPLPDFLTQSKIADSLDKELEMVKGNTTLMHNFQNKITEKINRVFDN